MLRVATVSNALPQIPQELTWNNSKCILREANLPNTLPQALQERKPSRMMYVVVKIYVQQRLQNLQKDIIENTNNDEIYISIITLANSGIDEVSIVLDNLNLLISWSA